MMTKSSNINWNRIDEIVINKFPIGMRRSRLNATSWPPDLIELICRTMGGRIKMFGSIDSANIDSFLTNECSFSFASIEEARQVLELSSDKIPFATNGINDYFVYNLNTNEIQYYTLHPIRCFTFSRDFRTFLNSIRVGESELESFDDTEKKFVLCQDSKILSELSNIDRKDIKTLRRHLFLSCCYGRVAIVQWFVKNNLPIHEVDDLGNSALQIAAAFNSVDIVKYIVSIDIDQLEQPNLANETPLYSAIKGQHERSAIVLSHAGANHKVKVNGKSIWDLSFRLNNSLWNNRWREFVRSQKFSDDVIVG